MLCLRCREVCHSATQLTKHLLDHNITCDFSCAFNCGHPSAPSLASISAHMRYCNGRLQMMLSQIPHRTIVDDNHYIRLHSTFPSMAIFRATLARDISRLTDTNFKSCLIDFLNLEADLNVLLDEFIRLLPPPKRSNRKRGRKKKKTNVTALTQPDPNKGRASEYARNQDLWDKNKRRLWDLIKFGDIRSKTEGKESEFFDFFLGSIHQRVPMSTRRTSFT